MKYEISIDVAQSDLEQLSKFLDLLGQPKAVEYIQGIILLLQSGASRRELNEAKRRVRSLLISGPGTLTDLHLNDKRNNLEFQEIIRRLGKFSSRFSCLKLH